MAMAKKIILCIVTNGLLRCWFVVGGSVWDCSISINDALFLGDLVLNYYLSRGIKP